MVRMVLLRKVGGVEKRNIYLFWSLHECDAKTIKTMFGQELSTDDNTTMLVSIGKYDTTQIEIPEQHTFYN